MARLGRVARSCALLVLVVASSVAAFAIFAVVINLVPLLAERGVDNQYCCGRARPRRSRASCWPARLRRAVHIRIALILLAMAAALGVLTSVVTLIVAAILAGMARGVFTLLQATAVADRWGPRYYGQLTGLLSVLLTITMALASLSEQALRVCSVDTQPLFSSSARSSSSPQHSRYPQLTEGTEEL